MALAYWDFKPSDVLFLLGILVCSRILFYGIYNLYFHPLAHIPGPFLARMSSWPSATQAWKGYRHLWLGECFKKYGNKVRVAPDTIIFRNPAAYRDVYGNRANVRRADFYDAFRREDDEISTINLIDNVKHAKSRRLLDLAFTSKSLKASADFMQQHIDRWHEILAADAGNDWTPPLNFTDRVNYLVFDILGDVCFGSSFQTMESEENPLKVVPRSVVKSMVLIYSIAKSPFLQLYIFMRPRGLAHLFKALRPESMVTMDDFLLSSINRGEAREKEAKKSGEVRQDMFHFVYNAQDSEIGDAAFRDNRLKSECALLLVAGSDSTSVTLSGLFFYLCHYLEVPERLRQEVTSIFESADDIVPGPKLLSCKYVRAVIDEAMRMVPAGMSELPRQVLPGGTKIDKEYFPEGTTVGTAAWCDAFNDEVYGDSIIYRPERWLISDTNSAEDVARIKANFHPFSIGPFNCAGTNFALQELMLVVAKTIHRFEFRFAPGWVKGEGLRHRRVVAGGREVPLFQLKDAYITVRDGPMLQFRRRYL